MLRQGREVSICFCGLEIVEKCCHFYLTSDLNLNTVQASIRLRIILELRLVGNVNLYFFHLVS